MNEARPSLPNWLFIKCARLFLSVFPLFVTWLDEKEVGNASNRIGQIELLHCLCAPIERVLHTLGCHVLTLRVNGLNVMTTPIRQTYRFAVGPVPIFNILNKVYLQLFLVKLFKLMIYQNLETLLCWQYHLSIRCYYFLLSLIKIWLSTRVPSDNKPTKWIVSSCDCLRLVLSLQVLSLHTIVLSTVVFALFAFIPLAPHFVGQSYAHIIVNRLFHAETVLWLDKPWTYGLWCSGPTRHSSSANDTLMSQLTVCLLRLGCRALVSLFINSWPGAHSVYVSSVEFFRLTQKRSCQQSCV